jgi:hypothetical protein
MTVSAAPRAGAVPLPFAESNWNTFFLTLAIAAVPAATRAFRLILSDRLAPFGRAHTSDTRRSADRNGRGRVRSGQASCGPDTWGSEADQ